VRSTKTKLRSMQDKWFLQILCENIFSLKIVIIHQHFRTPSEGGSIRSFYIARELSKRGHDVSVITASYNGKSEKKRIDNFTVLYLSVNYDNSFGFIRRLISYSTFVLKVILNLKKFKNPDICYAISTPLTVGITALFNKKFNKVPFAFEVGDIWPAIPIQMGILKNPILKFISSKLEKKIYKESNLIVAISSPVKEIIQTKTSQLNIITVPNFSDLELFSVKPKAPELEVKFACQNKFVISYIGTIGIANKLVSLVSLGEKMSDEVVILIMGSGAELSLVKTKVEELHLTNIFFLPYGSKSDVKELLNITDALYISFDVRFPLLFTGCPNKLCDGFAAGKLIIINYDGWQKNLIEENKVGIKVNHLSEAELDNLRKIINNRPILDEYKTNSRLLAEKFELNKLIDRLNDALKKIIIDV